MITPLLATLIGIVAFTLLAPVLGCFLSGLDRVISARMQGRVGPPVLQPYYDVRKLLSKDDVSTNGAESVYVTAALVFALVAGGIFFSGGNILLSIFLVTMGALFFIIAAYSSRSPYAEVGANREIMQVMAYEPMVLILAVGVYLASGTFNVGELFGVETPIICRAWLIFVGLLFILTIKLRKSPFDISMSHHAHQEIVRGMTTEMSGPTLAKVEIMHWVENVLFLGWVGMFFIWSNPLSLVLAIVVALAAWFLEILIDNNFARVKWQSMLKSAWIVALVTGAINFALLMFL